MIDFLTDAAAAGSPSPEYRLLELVLPDRGYALMFEAYFDESGTHRNSPIMCVAGYLIESDQCRRFQVEWDAVLSKYRIPYFHMSDCAHGSGVFAGVPKNIRSAICQSLIETIKLRAEIGIAVSVSESEFQSLMPVEFRVDPYSFCVSYCMQGVIAWAEKYKVAEPISYFFESGHKNESIANNLINWFRHSQSLVNGFRYHSHTFVSGKKLCGIAAADLLAWEFLAAHRNKFGPVRRPVRLSFQNLMRKTHIMMHFKEDDLREYFERGAAFQRGERLEIPEKFRKFISTRDFPGKSLGEL